MSRTVEALSAEEIHYRLQALSAWRVESNALVRNYEGKSYLQALNKLNAIAQLSEQADHHPELILSWRHLTIRYWTHVAQGITPLDFQLAEQVEALLQQE